jgi:hypothetical protein
MPAFVLEAWIVETPEQDKAFQTYGIKVPKGTLMMTTQITDKDVYNKLVKSGQVGYSIEGFLGLKLSEIKPPYHENCKCEEINGDIVSEAGVCDYCLEQSQFEINKKNKETKMEENKLNIPAGEYTDKDGKVFIVAEDGTISMKEVVEEEMACGPKEEKLGLEIDETAEVVEEDYSDKTMKEAKVKETELAEGDVVEVAPVIEPVQEMVSYTKEEVDAKFDELYKLIADLQATEVVDVVQEELGAEPKKMSVNERFEAFNRFFVNTKVNL